jgi:hypothetical protein
VVEHRWLNPPDPLIEAPIAEETDCCDVFQEPGVVNDDGTTYPTSNEIALTVGQKYGFAALMEKSAGEGRIRVAWRLSSDSTPAHRLQPIAAANFGTFAPRALNEPILSCGRDGENIMLTYEGALEETDDIDGPYVPFLGARSPWTVALSGAKKFYRASQ